jgi:four helix bundle protein
MMKQTGFSIIKLSSMFDFEKLEVYQAIRKLNKQVLPFVLRHKDIDPEIKKQWKRSTTGIALNLAEGNGRLSDADKRHFFTIARGSTYESVAILQIVLDLGWIEEQEYQEYYGQYEHISKMLYGLFKSKF